MNTYKLAMQDFTVNMSDVVEIILVWRRQIHSKKLQTGSVDL